MKLWIVGQYREPNWDFQGVFSSEEKAVAACRTPLYFVAPADLDAEAPHELAKEWPGAYYPRADEANRESP